MKKILECVRLEILMMLKSKLTIIYIIGFLAYNYLGLYYNNENIGYTLTRSAFVIEAGLFLFLILGFNTIQREEKYSCDEVFSSISYGKVSKAISKILSIIFSSIVINALVFTTYCIFYMPYKLPAVFYMQGIAYITLYYIIPFIITGCIGMIIGLMVKGKLAYLLLIFSWVLVGATNIVIFLPIIRITRTKFDFTSVANFFNLAQTDGSAPFHVIYGLPLELTRWFQKGMVLSLLMTALILIILLKSSRGGAKEYILSTIIGGIIITSFFILYLKPSQVIYTNEEEKSVMKYDWMYYSQHQKQLVPVENNFIIESYDIDLNIKGTMNVDVDVEFKALASIDKLTFSLYRDLKVSNASIDNKNLEYKQEGDALTIFLPANIEETKSSRIHISYSGTTSPMFFANEQAVMLPAYYAWLPREGDFQLMDPLTGHSPNTPHEAKYKLSYKGKEPLYTNLTYKGHNTWEGTVPHGITLLASDNILSKNIDNFTIYYPAAFFKQENEISKLYRKINEVNNNVNKDFQIVPNNSEAKSIFILTQPNIMYPIHPETYLFGDHIIQETTYWNFNYNPTYAATKRALTILKISNMENAMENKAYKPIADAYQYWYALRFEPEEVQKCLLSKTNINSSRSDLDKSLKKFIEDNKDKPETMINFFYSASEVLKTGDEEGFKKLLTK